MILVLASRQDLPARRLVAGWRAAGVATELLLCEDLARPGWRVGLGAADAAVVGSRAIPLTDLQAVVTRLPGVTAAEIPTIHSEDRAYAAAEMNAFLLAWLAGLRCPVLNRPTPGSLMGPPWSPAQWVGFAAGHKLKVQPASIHAVFDEDRPPAPPPPPEHELVQVVGDQAFGEAEESAKKAALRLAQAAAVEVLRVHFQPGEKRAAPTFLGADLWVDLDDPRVAEALLHRCQP